MQKARRFVQSPSLVRKTHRGCAVETAGCLKTKAGRSKVKLVCLVAVMFVKFRKAIESSRQDSCKSRKQRAHSSQSSCSPLGQNVFQPDHISHLRCSMNSFNKRVYEMLNRVVSSPRRTHRFFLRVR